MDETTKMLVFMFLGLIFGILILGFHASPKASPELGARRDRTDKPSPLSFQKEELYPSKPNPY